MSKVLVETAFPKLRIVEQEGNTPLRVSGVAAIADEVNGNGRVYPMKVLEREIAKLSDQLDRSDHAGFVDHPTFDSSVSDIGLKFTKLWMEEKLVKFEAEIVDTAKGRDLAAVIKAGIRIGISSRGNGTVKRGMWEGKNAVIVQDDFDLESYDAVVTPAVANARIVQYESKQRVIEALERIITNNSEKSYINATGSGNTISEKEMERTTEELMKLVQQYLDAKSVVNIDVNPEDEEPREQVYADPSDNPNEQPNPQPDPMNRDTSPLTKTVPNVPDVPISPEGDHPDPTMGDNPEVNPNENNPNFAPNPPGGTPAAEVRAIGAMDTGNVGLDAVKAEIEKEENKNQQQVKKQAEVTSVEGEYRAPARKSAAKKSDDDDDAKDVKDMLQTVLNRQDEITDLKLKLRDAESDAGVVAALAALSTSISDHLNKGEWGVVSNLASIASMLSWYAGDSENRAQYESLQKSRIVDSVLAPMVQMAERMARDEKIRELTDSERYGRSIASRLRDRTRNAAEVQTLFESIKDQVLRDANAGTGEAPKGTPLTDKKYTPEQQRLRELAGLTNED